MQKDELTYLSIMELSSLIWKKEISATELVKKYLERIERLQYGLKAYITVCDEEALASARAIDESRKKVEGPLMGVPIALKDQFKTMGVLTTNGSLVLRDHIPAEDATVVIKLKKAGAVLLGKLNMSEFAAAGGEDMPFGEPRNPWNLEYSPGGSSSGSGIAVAAGLCAGSIGEDTGGSGRSPANACGVAGLRPSSGLVSRYGMYPFSPSLDSASPIARTVADCAILLRETAGYDRKDPLSSRLPVPDYLASLGENIKGVRIGVIHELVHHPGFDPEVNTAIQTAITVMTGLGASINEISIPYINHSMYALGIIVWSEGAALNRKWLETGYQRLKQSTRLGFLAGSLLPSKVYQMARQAQGLIRSQTLEALEKYDVLLCSTSPVLTPKIEDAKKTANFPKKEDVVRRHDAGHLGFAPLAGCPAISVPCGFSQAGLPIGLQIVGRPFDESTVLHVAHAYERSTRWHNFHPDL
jgi:aspartyl-tRNA(Asn)/glutamyl-tRNA(Gln) amidotransferase subunit A